MDKFLKLLQERAKIIAELRAIVDGAEKRENSSFTDEETTKYEELSKRAAKMKADSEILRRQAELDMEEAGNKPGEQRGVTIVPGGDPEKRSFASLGHFLMEVRNAENPNIDTHPALITESRAAAGANVGVASDGGFLMGTEYTQGLLTRAYESGEVLSRCTKIEMSQGIGEVIINGIDENSRVNGSRWGGVRAYWAAEAATVEATKAKFAQIKLKPEKLMAFYYATDESLEDTVLLNSIIDIVVPEEIAFKQEEACIEGTGVGQNLGVIKSDATVVVAKRANQPANTIVYENILDMWARMIASSRKNAVWFINQDIETELNAMALVVGTGGVPVYLPAGGLSEKPYATLMGRPVIPIEHCKTLGTKGDIILSDMSQYILLQKGGIKKDVSIHVKFLTAEQCFRFIIRTNGRPIWDSALTPKNGTKTLSPWVVLANRS